MLKLVAISLLLAVVAAKPLDGDTSEIVASSNILPLSPTIIHEASLAKVGELIHHVPTAVSHQSSTIVHDTAKVVTPVVTPVLKTHYAAPLVQTYNNPYVRSYAASYPLTYHYPFGYYYQYS